MPKVSFPILFYENSDGTPLAYGSITVALTKDAVSPDGQVCASFKTKIPLDDNGEIIGSPVFYPNSTLNPSDTEYVVYGYTDTGQLAFGPMIVNISTLNYGFGLAFGDFFGS